MPALPSYHPHQVGNVSVAYWKDMIRARLYNNSFYLSDQVSVRVVSSEYDNSFYPSDQVSLVSLVSGEW